MLSIEKEIEKSIKDKPKGTLIFPDDFVHFGSSDAVRQALVRLVKKQVIVRVARGIYVRPKEDDKKGILLPTAEEIAYAIAKRDKIRIVPTDSYAMHVLSSKGRVAKNISLLTDGSPRVIKVGARTIKFKKSTPKNLLVKGKISGYTIQALKEIGKEQVTPQYETEVIESLKKENVSDLLHDIALAPVWIQKIMKKALIDDEN